MHEFGILFVATRDGRYVDEALASLKSLKAAAPDVPASLMTSMPGMLDGQEHDFDLVLTIPTTRGHGSHLAEARLDRWLALLRSPYERTLLLDTDVAVISDTISEMAGILEHADLALVRGNDQQALPETLAQHAYGTHLMGIRRSAAADHLIEELGNSFRAQLALADDAEAILEGDLSGLARLPESQRTNLLCSDNLALSRILQSGSQHPDLVLHELDGTWLQDDEHALTDCRARRSRGAPARTNEVTFVDRHTILFPQSLYWRQHKNVAGFNKQLAELADELCTHGPTSQAGASGGKRSQGNLLEHDAPVIGPLRQLIEGAINPFVDRGIRQLMPATGSMNLVITAWAHILEEGEYLPPHIHNQATVSGCYCVETPYLGTSDDGRQGRLIIENPATRADMVPTPVALTTQHIVDLNEGALVLFPAYLQHHVAPFRGTGKRIMIAFTASLSSAVPTG